MVTFAMSSVVFSMMAFKACILSSDEVSSAEAGGGSEEIFLAAAVLLILLAIFSGWMFRYSLEKYLQGVGSSGGRLLKWGRRQ